MNRTRSSYRPYLGPLHRPVLATLRTLGFRRLSEKWIRMSNPDYAWPLPGLLAGHVMQFRWREDFQYLAPHYEPYVCRAIQHLVQPGFYCADVGAHLGYMSLLMARQAGESGRVVAFEALPDNARLLQRNVELNRYEHRIRVVNAAVTDGSSPETVLHLGPSSFQSSVDGVQNFGKVSVPAVSLDKFFGDQDRLDFVKMDIEGAEVLAMPGMRGVLKTLQPTVLLEVHDGAWTAVAALLAEGYRICDLDLQPTSVETMKANGQSHCVAVSRIRTQSGQGTARSV